MSLNSCTANKQIKVNECQMSRIKQRFPTAKCCSAHHSGNNNVETIHQFKISLSKNLLIITATCRHHKQRASSLSDMQHVVLLHITYATLAPDVHCVIFIINSSIVLNKSCTQC